VFAHHVVRYAIDPLPDPRFICVGHPHPSSVFHNIPLLQHSLRYNASPVESIIFIDVIPVVTSGSRLGANLGVLREMQHALARSGQGFYQSHAQIEFTWGAEMTVSFGLAVPTQSDSE
jgi:hypothetical protein